MMEGKINASELNKAEKLYQQKHKTQRAILVREGGVLFRFIIWIINTDGFGRSSEKISLPPCGAETKHCVA